jgi:hypothetical protein
VRAPSFELEPGEELRASVPASFRGAAAASTRSMFALGSARMRQRSYEDWRNAVEKAGFPTAGPEMVLAVTSRRVAVFRTTFFANRPAAIGGSIELARIAQVATSRRGVVTSLAFALVNGQIIEVEAMRGARLRRFAEHVRTALEQNAR